MMKQLLIILTILFSTSNVKAQNCDQKSYIFLDVSGGYEIYDHKIVAKPEIGIDVKKLELSLKTNVPLQSATYVPTLVGTNLRYNFGIIKPFISYNYINPGQEAMNTYYEYHNETDPDYHPEYLKGSKFGYGMQINLNGFILGVEHVGIKRTYFSIGFSKNFILNSDE